MLKKILAVLLLSLVLSAGAGQFRGNTLQDIPGVTQEDIDAIEAIKRDYDHFDFGQMPTTEMFTMSDGTPAGFAIELCKLMSELFGIPFVPVECDWTELLTQFENGGLDFTGEVLSTRLENSELYSTDNIGRRSLGVYTVAEPLLSESDIDGMRVAFLKDSPLPLRIESVYPGLSFETVGVASFEEAAESLISGEADAFITASVAYPMMQDYGIVRAGELFGAIYLSNEIKTSKPELEPVITVLNKYLDSGGLEKIYELYELSDKQYATYELLGSFTDEERAYIESGKTVKVAFESDNYPVSFYNDAEGEFQGIAPEILAGIAEMTGIRFENVTNKNTTWAEIYEMLRTGEISLVTQLLRTTEREAGFLFSEEPYAYSRYALLSRMEMPYITMRRVQLMTVGTVIDTAYEAKYHEWFPDSTNTVRYNTHIQALDALDRGDIDLLMASDYIMLTQTNYRERPGCKVNIAFDDPMDSYFGFNKDEALLCSIISKTQAGIDTLKISNSWADRVYDYAKQLTAERARFLSAFLILSTAALVLLLFLFYKNKQLNKNLEHMVRDRTFELEDKTAILVTIFNSIPDFVFCKDPEGRYMSCNNSFERLVGRGESELAGKTPEEAFKDADDSLREFIKAYEHLMSTSVGKLNEALINDRIFEARVIPLEKSGTVIGTMGIARDVTDSRQVERTLRRRYKQQKLMAELSQSFVSGGELEDMIEKAMRMTGEFMNASRVHTIKCENRFLEYRYEWLDPAQSTESKLGGRIGLSDYFQWLVRQFEDGSVKYYNLGDYDREEVRRRHNMDASNCLIMPLFVGGVLWGTLKFDRHGEFVPWTQNDITLAEMVSGALAGAIYRKLTERDLLRMSALVNSSPQYISYVNKDGMYDFFNPAACDVTGYSREELIENGIKILYDDETNALINRDILPEIFRKGNHTFEVPLIRKDGSKRIMAFSAFTISSDEYGAGSIAIDVTDQRTLENQLVEAKEFAERNSRAKSEFLSRMSHEIRTPMNAIIGMTKIARTAESAGRKDHCLEKIDIASGHLLGIINDVLDMSKIEAGKIEIMRSAFSLERMLMRTINYLTFRMEEKGQSFSMELDPNVPKTIVSDEQRLNQVITNLLGNAIKFTPERGTISLYTRKLSERDGLCELEFEVKDNGIGITPEQAGRLFHSFEQADSSISRKYGGTGLGLSISKHIVELLGGTIRVESEPGSGSRFIFTILAELSRGADDTPDLASSEEEVTERTLSFKGKRILLAEDVEINREIVLSMLEDYALSIDCAADGGEAVRMFKENPDYDLIFMDIQMPEVDGFEATRMIRALHIGRAADVPIIAMTANVFREDVEACLKAGMNGHIGKPLESGELLRKLKQYL